MVLLPERLDPTLEAIDKAIEERASCQPKRTYLGASAIGMACERAIWYSIQPDVPRKPFTAATLRRFEDGHAVEAQMIYRLRMVYGIELHTHSEHGNQYGFQDFGGRFRGHVDGLIRGLLQAPETPHVFECKAVNHKKFGEFQKLKAILPEKDVLARWDEVYHAQAVTYCYYFDMTRHYLVVSTPGGREYDSCRTNADNGKAQRLREKAKRILDATHPPARISERKEWFQCKWCDFRDFCHA